MSEPPPLFNGTMSSTPKHLSVAPKKSTPKKNSGSLSQSSGTPSASGSITLASTTKKSKESKLKKKDKERSTSIGIGGSAPGEKLFNGKVEPRESSLAADPFVSSLPLKKKSKLERERERERERLDRETSEKPLKETSSKPRKDRSPSTLPKIKAPKFEPEPTPPTGSGLLDADDDDNPASPIPSATVSTGTGNTNTLAGVITHPLLAASLRAYNAAHPPSSSSTPPTSLSTFPTNKNSLSGPGSELTRTFITTGEVERLKVLLMNGLKTTGWYENCAKIVRQKYADGSTKSFEDMWAQMKAIATADTVDEGVKEEVVSAIAESMKANGFDESGGQRKKPRLEKEG